MGYPNTTGLDCIQYRITDAQADPPATTQPFSERLVRLPGSFLCLSSFHGLPDIAPLPCKTNGYVTFGSMNQLAKVHDECFEVWVRLLLTLDDSHLHLKAGHSFSDTHVREMWYKKFEERGIGRDRVLLVERILPPSGLLDDDEKGIQLHLEEYRRIGPSFFFDFFEESS